MKMKRVHVVLAMAVVAIVAAGAQAAFIVEAHSSGWANANFSGTPRYSTGLSAAVGLKGTMSAYGSTVADPVDVYVYSYTPGTDADNAPIAAGIDLGNGVLSSGMTGGGTGPYNVYITWPASNNVVSLCDIVVTNDGADVVTADVDMDDDTNDPVMSDGINVWKLIAAGVPLTAGNTYTVTQTSQDGSWTSMRSSGVMFEMVPEPASMLLLGAGALLLRRRR
jgi:hypothetical protein